MPPPLLSSGAPDGCTYWPDIWFGRSITHCCNDHDIAYALGHPPRAQADVNLAHCVAGTTGSEPLALLMLLGVTICGGIFWRRARRAP